MSARLVVRMSMHRRFDKSVTTPRLSLIAIFPDP